MMHVHCWHAPDKVIEWQVRPGHTEVGRLWTCCKCQQAERLVLGSSPNERQVFAFVMTVTAALLAGIVLFAW